MADYFLMEGNKFLKKHDFKRALALADSAELYAIKKDDVYFFKGRIYSELGRFSKADQATIGFIVEPGAYKPETVLFMRGLFGFFCISIHFFLSIPYKNKFGLIEGEEFIATISPV